MGCRIVNKKGDVLFTKNCKDSKYPLLPLSQAHTHTECRYIMSSTNQEDQEVCDGTVPDDAIPQFSQVQKAPNCQSVWHDCCEHLLRFGDYADIDWSLPVWLADPAWNKKYER